MSMLKRLQYVFTAGPELDNLIKAERRRIEDEEHKKRAHHLNLCEKHQQEHHRSHYSEANCDYCKLKHYLETGERPITKIK